MRVLLLTLLLCTACLREPFRPVATAHELGGDALQCDDVRVHAGNGGAWGRDPHGNYDAYLVRGCGREAWFACSPAFVHEGTCAPIPMGPYVSPAPGEPHALLYTELQDRRLSRHAVGKRELIIVGAEGWVVRERRGPAPGLPLAPGVHVLAWSARNTDIETLRHATRIGDSVNEWTSHHPVPGEGCGRRFQLTVRAGARYQLRLDMSDLAACAFTCVEARRDRGVSVQAPCTGALLDDTRTASAPTRWTKPR
ncbi:MAG: hypothetical protein AAF447_03310 [Myxococcota bacterium]